MTKDEVFNPQKSEILTFRKEQVKVRSIMSIIHSIFFTAFTAVVIVFFITGGMANTGYLWIFAFLAFVFSLSLLFFISFMFFFQRKRDSDYELLKRKVEYLRSQTQVTEFLQLRMVDLEKRKAAMTHMTEDILAERDRLEKQMAKDAAILQSIGEGLFATDTDGNVVLINPFAQELLEIKEEEVLGKPAYKLFALYDEEGNTVVEEKRSIYITLKTARDINQIYVYTRKDGRKVSLNFITTPIKQRSQVIGAICVVRDITKEKEVDRMKTEFISLASHQLRTPLSAIKWFTEMLLAGDGGKLNPEQSDFAQNISDSTERMIDLVNSLLNISRIESGRIIINSEPTDLKKLVESIATELAVKFEQKHQAFILTVHDNLSQINIDPRLIRQVYLNLLTNASKYSPAGGEITVFISRKNEEVISQVSDNGYGIPKTQQGKVFQKFFRSENVVKIETDGSGLGLYLVKAIIESSKGKIWFESHTKEESLPAGRQGTTFWFSLPLSGVEQKKGK